MSDATPVGWVLNDTKLGGCFRSHIYHNVESARAALAGIVWHSRERYVVAPVYLAPPQVKSHPDCVAVRCGDADLSCLDGLPCYVDATRRES